MDSDFAALIYNVQQIQLSRYFKVAIFSAFITDYFHTLATEIETLWPAPWTIVKVIFLISRYTPFLDGPIGLASISLLDPSPKLCTVLLRVQLWSAGIGGLLSQLLLFYRAHALVGRTRFSAILLSSLASIMIILDLIFMPVIQRNIEVVDGNVPSVFPKCFVSNTDITTNRLIVVAPIDTIIFETILFVVIYWAKMKKYKEERNSLIRKIYRDAFLYYLLLFLISAISLIVWFGTRGPIRELSPTMPRYFISMISSRIILNIRQYASKSRAPNEAGVAGTGEATAQPVSGIQFARIKLVARP